MSAAEAVSRQVLSSVNSLLYFCLEAENPFDGHFLALSLDTNVLVRLLVKDDELQTQVVLRTSEKHVRRA